MFNYLEKIKQLIPEPANDIKCDAGNEFLANEIEIQNGIVLPSDYKELINHFGTGIFGKTIYISSYLGKHSIFKQQKEGRDFFYSMLKNFPVPKDEVLYSFFPEKDGLLFVGGDENACSLMWLTQGPPEEWSLLFFDDYMQNESRFDMPITEFLYQWLIGEVSPGCLVVLEGDPVIPCERNLLFVPSHKNL